MGGLASKVDEVLAEIPMKEAVRYKKGNLKWTRSDVKKHSEALACGLIELGCKVRIGRNSLKYVETGVVVVVVVVMVVVVRSPRLRPFRKRAQVERRWKNRGDDRWLPCPPRHRSWCSGGRLFAWSASVMLNERRAKHCDLRDDTQITGTQQER